MKLLGVLVLVCAVERVAAAAPAWSITWPAEWTDMTQEALKQPDMQVKLKQLAGLHATTDVAARADAEGHVVQVVYTAVPLDDGDPGTAAVVRGFEQGARNAARQGGREVSYHQREVGNTLDAEQTLELDGATVYVRWIAGAGHERMRGVQAFCNASQALCATVLGSLALDPTELEPLTAGHGRWGRVRLGTVGRIVGILLGGLLGWWLISRAGLLRRLRR